MAGWGAALGGAAKAFNQGYDERTRMEMAARLEKEREEARIKMTPTETLLQTIDGVIYRQAVNAYGEPVGPRKQLSDIEAKALQQKQALAQQEVEKGNYDLTSAKAEAGLRTLQQQLEAQYGAATRQSALDTDEVQRQASKSNMATGAAYADQARAVAAASRANQSRQQQGIDMFIKSQLNEEGGPPTADTQASIAAMLINPDTVAGNFTRPVRAGSDQMALSRENVMNAGDTLLKEIDNMTDIRANPNAIAPDDPRIAELAALRTAIVQARISDPDGSVMRALNERFKQIQESIATGSSSTAPVTSSTSSAISDIINAGRNSQ